MIWHKTVNGFDLVAFGLLEVIWAAKTHHFLQHFWSPTSATHYKYGGLISKMQIRWRSSPLSNVSEITSVDLQVVVLFNM
jgi:hypothetical protein